MGLGALLIFFGVALLSVRLVIGRSPRARLARARDRRRRGRARPRQRAAEPAADGLDRGGADDRPRARDARRGARRRDHVDVPRRGRRPLDDADYAITAQNNFSPIPISAGEPAPGARRRGGRERPHGDAQVFGDTTSDRRRPADAAMSSRSTGRRARRPSSRNSATTARSSTTASPTTTTSGSAPRSRLTIADGDKLRFKVEGIFDPPTGGSPFGPVTISSRPSTASTRTRGTSTRS